MSLNRRSCFCCWSACARPLVFWAMMGCFTLTNSTFAFCQERSDDAKTTRRAISQDILTDQQWKEIESSVDKGLTFLVSQQRNDGSFQAEPINEPAISALCLMAFLSRGHVPGQGPYGEQLEKTVRFILSAQQPDGMVSLKRHSNYSVYNHGISSLVLSELYGMSPPDDQDRMRKAIESALKFTSLRYPQPKRKAHDEGSWRYLERERSNDGDLSITSWNVMFLRSAKNSGFDIDIKLVDEALTYMKQLYDPGKAFRYAFYSEAPNGVEYHRAMAGAAILSLSLAGEHHSEMATGTAGYLLKHPFNQYERPEGRGEFICYAAFYTSHGMFQMGGEYWSEFYPRLVKSLLETQRQNGSWLLKNTRENEYGASYMTALSILALTPPYQMLPIFQR